MGWIASAAHALSMVILKAPFRTDFIWVGLCLLGAVFFMFKNKILG